MSERLSERQKRILHAVVVEYIVAAEPVGSEFIANKYSLGVRGATIRNELAEITDLGYLEQPHTSAGRIPSDEGYRYYVDHMILGRRVGPDDRGRIESASKEEETTRDLVSESIKALSKATRLLTAAVTVRDATATIRHAVVTVLGPDKALLVLMLANGHTENRMVDCPAALTLEQLGRANAALDALVSGKSMTAVLKAKLPLTGDETTDLLLKRTGAVMKSLLKDLTAGHIMLEGEEFILAQPEFRRDPEILSELLDSLGDEGSLMAELAGQSDGERPITIGRENLLQRHKSLSFVRRSFFVGDDQAGVVAVIGPTRMDYERNVAVLDFTAEAISKTLTKLFR